MVQVQMNGAAFRSILAKDTSHAAKLLWLLLVLDDVVTTRDGAARMLGLSVRQAERAAAELQAVGALEVKPGWKVGVYSLRRVWCPVLQLEAAAEQKTTEPSQMSIDDVIKPSAGAVGVDVHIRGVSLFGSTLGLQRMVGPRMSGLERTAFNRACPRCGEVAGNFCDVVQGDSFCEERLLGSASGTATNEPTAEDKRAAKRFKGVKGVE